MKRTQEILLCPSCGNRNVVFDPLTESAICGDPVCGWTGPFDDLVAKWKPPPKVEIKVETPCTWKEGKLFCENNATHEKISDAGGWANLCDKHQKAFEWCLYGPRPETVVLGWVRAIGGNEEAAEYIKKRYG